MVCTLKNGLNSLKNEDDFETVSSIKAFYKKVVPTNLSVIRLFSTDKRSEAERDAFKFLKKYVRGLSENQLKILLRFCTGSDIMLAQKNSLSFVSFQSNFERRPIAHTCQPLLELPNSYSSFCELREEFENILDRRGFDTYLFIYYSIYRSLTLTKFVLFCFLCSVFNLFCSIILGSIPII